MDLHAFSEWLRWEMDRQGMTQADLARGSGLSTAHISRILNMVTEPSKDSLPAIARALHIPPELIFQKAGILPPSPETNPTIERAIYYLSQLLPEDQERVMLYLEVLASRYKREKKRP